MEEIFDAVEDRQELEALKEKYDDLEIKLLQERKDHAQTRKELSEEIEQAKKQTNEKIQKYKEKKKEAERKLREIEERAKSGNLTLR